jgi:hypothetical protein
MEADAFSLRQKIMQLAHELKRRRRIRHSPIDNRKTNEL